MVEHTNEQNEDKCLEYNEKTRLSDNEVREHLKKLGLQSISELQRLEIDRRNVIVRELKSIEGITIRQLSRILGISKSVIDRI